MDEAFERRSERAGVRAPGIVRDGPGSAAPRPGLTHHGRVAHTLRPGRPPAEGVRPMGEETIALNRKARHEYTIDDTFEAGIVLTGTEIKSIRAHKVNLADAYVRIDRGEAWMFGMHIAPWETGNRYNHEAKRTAQAPPPSGRDHPAPVADQAEGPDDGPAQALPHRVAGGPRSRWVSPAASSSTTDGGTSPTGIPGATSPASWPTSSAVAAERRRGDGAARTPDWRSAGHRLDSGHGDAWIRQGPAAREREPRMPLRPR